MRLAAPSFIISASRIENVCYLHGKVDEVELLYFCSQQPEDLPDTDEVAALAREPMRYNIHMPYDRDLAVVESWQAMEPFATRLQPVNATTHTFHLQPQPDFFRHLEHFIHATQLPISVENGGDDAHLFSAATALPVDFCVDIGHIIHHKRDAAAILAKHSERITLLHLHGSNGQRDHRSLKFVDIGVLRMVKQFAVEQDVTICLEIFQEDALHESIQIMRDV
ncbi:cobamide remodeling phosphodiesterase CbiR [Chrysiogenes arsenatis]|uniref:cobamide remodeling phosphodiesterase CbiR n=1 Tax=Chrysiogenes arsenatis TaxID=309797 RepID=UPI00040C91C0|nr:cobamide remodeling phosphodiesterase CbiR [Chrysiogenes arsenatis]